MKPKPKKSALPRLAWSIKPVTHIKGSAKAYSRRKEKSNLRKEGV